jgi:hypothetical protein
MKSRLSYLLFLASLFSLATHAQTVKTLNPLAAFGSNGRIEPTSLNPVLDTGTNQRGFAADPVTGNLVLVDAHSGSGGGAAVLGNIFVIDGTYGTNITTLNTNGINGGTYADTSVVIADDGVVYVCNQVNNSGTTPFTIYRWDSVSSTNLPTIAFSSTITPTQRYGVSMDVRGAGANTQIIIGSTPNSTTATNVVIFTTADGLVFTAHALATDATTANFQEGIAFGPGNTFWAKKIGAPLRYMSFDLANSNATTIASFDTNSLPLSGNLGPLAVDNTNHLLAAIEVFSGTTGSERVFLYDISSPSRPLLLDIRNYNPNNTNATAPPGYLDFNAGRLYSHVINNGLAAFSVDDVATPAPIILVQPAASTRLVAGQTLSLLAVGYPAVSYQWQKGGTNILNATNAFLTIANVQATNAGTYRAVLSNANSPAVSSDAVVNIVSLSELYHFNPLWTAVPSSTNYVTGTGGNAPNERGIAYNVLSNQLYVVQKSGINWDVHVIDGTTGQKLYKLNTNGVVPVTSEVSGSNPNNLCAAAVADDGAIYICNESPNAGGGTTSFNTNKYFRVYRWANSSVSTPPVEIFHGDPANQGVNYRWGDVINVRGSGTNTQIILDNQLTTGNHYMAILVPVDDTMTNWINKPFFLDNALPFGTSIGRSLEFGSGNVYFSKRRGAALLKLGFDPDNTDPNYILPLLGTFAFTNTTSGVWQNAASKVLVGMSMQANGVTTPDSLDLYDMTDLSAPLKIAGYNFPQNHSDNGNFIGWAVWSTNRVYALCANNGILAMELVPGPPGPPIIVTQPRDTHVVAGAAVSLNVTLDSTAAVRWQKNGSNISGATNLTFSINSTTTNDSGAYRCIATNSFGSATSLVATVTVDLPGNYYSLTNIWTAPPDTKPYVTSTGGSATPNERAFAYHSRSNQLLVVQCPVTSAAVPTPTFSVQVVNAINGDKLYDLRTDNIGPIGQTEVSGSNPINLSAIVVANDGAVYACSGTPNASGGASFDVTKMFHVYRWPHSGPDAIPVSVFAGDPASQTANFRWGDVMTVRGSGTETELVLDSNGGNFGAILKPVDSNMTAFTNYWWNSSGGGSIGRSLQFETNNTIWQKRKAGALVLSSYDTNTQSSTILASYNGFSSSLGPVAVDTARNVTIGLDFFGTTNGPDAVALYSTTSLSFPLLVAKYNFPANEKANQNFIGQVIFAGDKVFVLDANNGIMAFTLLPPANSALPLLAFSRSGSTLNLSWSDSSAILQSTPSLNPTNWTDLTVSGQTSYADLISGFSKFYRLKK